MYNFMRVNLPIVFCLRANKSGDQIKAIVPIKLERGSGCQRSNS